MTEFDKEINSVVGNAFKSISIQEMGFKRKQLGEPQVQIYITHLQLDPNERQAVMQAGDWLMNFIRTNRNIK